MQSFSRIGSYDGDRRCRHRLAAEKMSVDRMPAPYARRRRIDEASRRPHEQEFGGIEYGRLPVNSCVFYMVLLHNAIQRRADFGKIRRYWNTFLHSLFTSERSQSG